MNRCQKNHWFLKVFAITLYLVLSLRPAGAVDFVSIEGGPEEEDSVKFGDAASFGVAIGWEWDKKLLTLGNWYVGSYLKLAVSYWDDSGDSLVDFGLTPIFRLQSDSTVLGLMPYIEGGLGVHVHTDDNLGSKDFSIPFAFGSHGGAGARFGTDGRYELGDRYQHLSNASLGSSNPGIDFHLFHLSYYF